MRRRLTPRAARILVPDTSTEADRIALLKHEAELLRPYSSTHGLRRLKNRLAEIEAAVARLEGLPLEEPADA